jgi:uncharacterized protein (DUF58 family)
VLLDTRTAAHRGAGSAASLEWAVSAAASIALHLSHHGYVLRLLTDADADLDAGAPGVEGLLLDHLADVRPSRRAGLEVPTEALRRTGGGLLVAVLGLVDPDEVPRLAALRTSGTTCVAILLDASSWADLPPDRQERADAAYEASIHALARAGWHVLRAARGTDLAELWTRAGEYGAAPRSAGARR